MNLAKVAMIGLVTLSSSAFAVPVLTGSAEAVKPKKGFFLPDVGTDMIVIDQNMTTGAVSIIDANGNSVAGREATSEELQKVCYGGPCGQPHGPDIYFEGGRAGLGGPYVEPEYIEPDVTTIRKRSETVIQLPNGDTVIRREFKRKTIIDHAPQLRPLPPPVLLPEEGYIGQGLPGEGY